MDITEILRQQEQHYLDGVLCKMSRWAVDEAISEIKQLRAENERLQEQLQDAIEAMRWGVLDHKDAERYRWLRHAIFNNPQNISPFPEKEIERLIANGMSEEDSLDYAIDAAMKGGER